MGIGLSHLFHTIARTTLLLSLTGAGVAHAQMKCTEPFDRIDRMKQAILPIHISESFRSGHGVEINSSGITYINVCKLPWVLRSHGQVGKTQSLEKESVIFQGHLDTQASKKALFRAEAAFATADGRDNALESKFDLTSGISFNARTMNPDLIYTVIFDHPSGTRLEYDLQIPRDLTHFDIPWEKFTIVAPAGKPTPTIAELFSINRPVIAGHNHVGFAVEVHKERQKKSLPAQQNFSLSFEGPMVLEKDLKDPGLFQRMTELPLNDKALMKNPLRIKVMKKMIENLYNLDNQIDILNLARQGDKTIIHEIKKLGLGVVYLDGALTFEDFFDVHGIMNTYPLHMPVEKSDFGRDHSVWAHAVQALIETKNFSPEELQMFKDIYRNIFQAQDHKTWGLWDTMFDGTGVHRANSPLYWREFYRQAGIVENYSPADIHWQQFSPELRIGLE